MAHSKLPQSDSLRTIVLKRDEFTEEIIREVNDLLNEVAPELPEEHFTKNHLSKPLCEFYLTYIDNKLYSIQSLSCYWIRTSTKQKPSFVFIGGLSYKRKHSSLKNMTRKISIKHLKKNLGRFWFLKEFYAIIQTVNPRLYLQAKRFFPDVYPKPNKKVPEEIVTLANKAVSINDGFPSNIDDHLVYIDDNRYHEMAEITDKYNSVFYTNDKEANSIFENLGIIKKEGDKIFVTKETLVIVGHFKPWSAMRKLKFISR